MSASEVIKTQFDCGTIEIIDGTPTTPLTVTVALDRGDFSLSGVMEGLKNVAAYQTRGELKSLRKTDRAFPTGSFSAMVAEFSDDTAGTVADMLLGNGEFAARTRTTRVPGDAMTLDVKLTVEGTDYGDDADQVITLQDCVLTMDFTEGDPDTLTFNFTCYGDIAGDVAQAADTCA
jgi:hypothetical protein